MKVEYIGPQEMPEFVWVSSLRFGQFGRLESDNTLILRVSGGIVTLNNAEDGYYLDLNDCHRRKVRVKALPPGTTIKITSEI